MAYASSTDLTTVGLPAVALGPLTGAQISAALQNASDFADTYLRARYGTLAVPLLVNASTGGYDTSLVQAVAKIATYYIMIVRGMKPGGPDFELFLTGYNQAVDWLNKVQRQQAHPLVTLAAVNQPGSTQPAFASGSVVNLASGQIAPNRGW